MGELEVFVVRDTLGVMTKEAERFPDPLWGASDTGLSGD